MIYLLQLFDSTAASREITVRRFPFTVGRGANADLQVGGAGVWRAHFSLDYEPGTGVRLTSAEGAITRVNGEPVKRTRLRPGDYLEAGDLRLRFWLAPVAQRSLQGRETLAWLALAAFVVFEVGLLFGLPQ